LRAHYVLIDYENVQPEDMEKLDAEHFKVLLFVGANQTKLSFDLAASMQKLGARGEYIKISSNGSNALDFHIAFYVGNLAAQDATACFHIVSKDTGFDPLITHLLSRKIAISRSKTLEDIPLLKSAGPKPGPGNMTVVVANLRQRGAAKPRTVKTLASTIKSLFPKQLGDKEVASLIAELQSKGYILVQENKVTYVLP